jgi:hypothetical protein
VFSSRLRFYTKYFRKRLLICYTQFLLKESYYGFTLTISYNRLGVTVYVVNTSTVEAHTLLQNMHSMFTVNVKNSKYTHENIFQCLFKFSDLRNAGNGYFIYDP